MEEKGNKNNLWWGPALEVFGQVSAWVVVPIVGALIIGKILDAKFGTKPWIFLSLTGIGFLISSFGIVRTVTKYIRKINKELSEKKDGNNNTNGDSTNT
ncbi:MAG: AtpZ/AtpI family protein [Candidatus Taylorbacteria bacterium]